MENNKRIVLSVALVTIIAIAAIGIGYAYSATTTNSGNDATVEYLTLVQGGNGAYTFTTANHNVIEWNTVDVKNDNTTSDSDFAKTNFKLASPEGTSPVAGYTLQQIGQDIVIKTTSSKTSGLVDQTCKIGATGFTPKFGTANDVAIFLKVVVNETTTLFKYDTVSNSFKVWTSGSSELGVSSFQIPDNNESSFYDATISVYYGYSGTDGITITHAKGAAPTGPDAQPLVTQPLVNATLTFTVDPVE